MKLLFYLITDKAVLDSAVSKYTVEHDSAASEFSNFSARNRKHIEEHLMIWRRGPYWVRLKKKKKYRGKNLITLSLTKYLPAIFFLFASAKSCDTENWILAIFLHIGVHLGESICITILDFSTLGKLIYVQKSRNKQISPDPCINCERKLRVNCLALRCAACEKTSQDRDPFFGRKLPTSKFFKT